MTDRRENIFSMKGNPITLLGREIKVGDQAPDFTVLRSDLSPFSLKDAGDKIKIISVLPSLDTGVCEMQTISFNEMAADLGDVLILTISVDLPFAQTRFCGAHGIDQVITLSDHRELSFGLNYGFVIGELRLLSRGVVVLDRDNTVRYVEYVKEVGSHPDYDRVLEEVKKLV